MHTKSLSRVNSYTRLCVLLKEFIMSENISCEPNGSCKGSDGDYGVKVLMGITGDYELYICSLQ